MDGWSGSWNPRFATSFPEAAEAIANEPLGQIIIQARPD